MNESFESSDFVAQIYEATLTTTAAEFRQKTLEKLRERVPFDGALWGNGNLQSTLYHSVETLGLPRRFPNALEQSSLISPLRPYLLTHIGRPINSAVVIPDAEFYATEFYREVLSPVGIQRIMTIGFIDSRSELYTHIALYRNDRELPFTVEETGFYGVVTPHFARAASQAFFIQARLRSASQNSLSASALCDRFGVMHDVDDDFYSLLSKHYPNWSGPKLPSALSNTLDSRALDTPVNQLIVNVEPLRDMFWIQLREADISDRLSPREREVVDGLIANMTYKEIARQMNISASSVSTMIYRAYLKLGINSRSQLAERLGLR